MQATLITGGALKVAFFGVGANDAYHNPARVGMKRGPTGKAEYIFSMLVSLNIALDSITTVVASGAQAAAARIVEGQSRWQRKGPVEVVTRRRLRVAHLTAAPRVGPRGCAVTAG